MTRFRLLCIYFDLAADDIQHLSNIASIKLNHRVFLFLLLCKVKVRVKRLEKCLLDVKLTKFKYRTCFTLIIDFTLNLILKLVFIKMHKI